MEIQTELKTYRIDKQCDKCKEGLMEKTGHSIYNGFSARYDHKCNKCGNTEEYTNKYYPRIIYKDEVKFTPENEKI